MAEIKTQDAPCSNCGGSRRHEVLHVECSTWEEQIEGEEFSIDGGDRYTLLKCRGCETVRLKHENWFSEVPETTTYFYPPTHARASPAWLTDGWQTLKLPDFVEELLSEVYSAIHNKSARLAAMGVRSLLEQIMVDQTGDQGSFGKNLQHFASRGHLSASQKERLTTILEAGHATTHRNFSPSSEDINILLDIAEAIVADIYIHPSNVDSLKKRIPARKKP